MRWTTLPLLLALAAPAVAQTAPPAFGAHLDRHGGEARIYDRDGRYVGRSESRNGVTRHYDRSGRYRGRSEEGPDGTLRHYDAEGRFQGRSERR